MLRTKALLIALAAASADAANLRASESRRLAGHGGHDDGDCADDPQWCASGVLNREARERVKSFAKVKPDRGKLANTTSCRLPPDRSFPVRQPREAHGFSQLASGLQAASPAAHRIGKL